MTIAAQGLFKHKHLNVILHITLPFSLKKNTNDYLYITFKLCWGRFTTKAKIVEISPKLPLGSLNSSVIWRAKPKIHNVRYTKANGALWKEKPTQNENTRKCRNYMFISQKFQPTVTKRKNLREVPSKRGRVPRYQYFHLQAFKSSIH